FGRKRQFVWRPGRQLTRKEGFMKQANNVSRLVWLATWVLVAVGFSAQARSETPHDIVSKVTDTLVSAAQSHGKNPDQEAFDATVLEALEPVVAFDYIARVV